MMGQLAELLETEGGAICAAASERLACRAEFQGEPELLRASLARLMAALMAGASSGDPEPLAQAALELGRDDSDCCRAYGRVQMLLDALCTEAVDHVRLRLSSPGGRQAAEARPTVATLRGLLGPAMLGLASLCRDCEAESAGRADAAGRAESASRVP